MVRALWGLFLDSSPEMPHAEKNLSYHVPDSSIEPCLKKSRSDSSSWERRDPALCKEQEAKSQKWDFSTGTEERCHQPNRCESEGGSGGIHVKYESDTQSYRSGKEYPSERDCNKTNQHSFLLPKGEKPEYNSDVTFSGTSTSFIGPLCKPSPLVKPLAEEPRNGNAASSFRIDTVELGKLASQSKGQDGMDYELRQFYKELGEIETVADDQAKKATCTEVDGKQDTSPYPDKIPPMYPPNHGHVPTSLPFGPFPSASSHFLSLTCHAREEPRPQLERSPLPPNNQFSCYGQAPYRPAISLLASYAVPPPRGPTVFDSCHPPTFIVPYGPPPPRFNYPVTFQRPSNTLPPPPTSNFSYITRNEPPPWHGAPAPPESRFTSQGMPDGKPFSQSTSKRTWQEPQQNDHCRPEDGQLGERILPHTGILLHQQHLDRFRDSGKRRMVLLRGVPGSGKSTLARTLLHQSPDGIVLSTDDYFCKENGYTYHVKLLGDAHSWNQNRARRAMDDGRSPVVIDNTNIQGWEMKPYVQMAVDRGYDVEFLEPDNWWKEDAQELEKTYKLKEKHHRRRYRKNGRKVMSKKHDLSSQEDEELENLAAEETRSDYNMRDCLTDAEEIGKVQVKNIYFEKETYLSDSLAALLSCCSILRTPVLFESISRFADLMDSPKTQTIHEVQILGTHRQYLLSFYLLFLVVSGMLCKRTNHVRPFSSWLHACSKGSMFHVTDQAHSRGQDFLNSGYKLYSSLINDLAAQTLRLYFMKCFKLQNCNFPKHQLTKNIKENQVVKFKQNILECKRLEEPDLMTEISEHECLQIMYNTILHVETKRTTPGYHKCHRKTYKLAPTFWHPRMFSATWENEYGDGANLIYKGTDATLLMQNALEDNDIKGSVTDECNDDLTRRRTSCRSKDTSVGETAISEDDLYKITSICSYGQISVTRSYSSFLPRTQFCAGFGLPEQFARQLVELFGCPGVELDSLEAKDFILLLGYDLAQRIYLQWKKSLQVKYEFVPAK
ncbi:uncharacterized protein [Phyllobates terribilis]|uniref:uncharacterized protein isoform X2 n=1 Tax=Phyllobates terribilis TaxID=111132 RepID=UPI003CCB348F